MVDQDDAGRAETRVKPQHHHDETVTEEAGRKLKEAADKVGCAANVALDNFEDHQGRA